jgi:hypothetical protein
MVFSAYSGNTRLIPIYQQSDGYFIQHYHVFPSTSGSLAGSECDKVANYRGLFC